MIKKGLLLIIAAAAVIVSVGCSKEHRWSERERAELRKELRAYRDMVYLDNLAELEFDNFSGDVVEAIEFPGERFVLGLQWHPEAMPDNEVQQKIFRRFVEAAKKK